jgi:TPR repeat protein
MPTLSILSAFAYEKGVGVPQDLAEAAKWYRRAAEAGHPRSMSILVEMYAAGRGGLPRDDAQAVNWLQSGGGWRRARHGESRDHV